MVGASKAWPALAALVLPPSALAPLVLPPGALAALVLPPGALAPLVLPPGALALLVPDVWEWAGVPVAPNPVQLQVSFRDIAVRWDVVVWTAGLLQIPPRHVQAEALVYDR